LRAVVVGDGQDAAEGVEAWELAGVAVVATAATVDTLSVNGDRAVEQVVVDRQEFAADTVVVALGKQPDPELALQALCEIGYSELDGVFVPLRSELLESSVSGVYVVGDAAGICTLAEARAEGVVAGLAAGGGDVEQALKDLAGTRSSQRLAQTERLRLAGVTGG
jgi:thioredoxin reductase